MFKIFIYWILKKVGVFAMISNMQNDDDVFRIKQDVKMLETSLEFLINNYDKRLRWKLKRILTNTRSPFYFKKVKKNNSHAQSAVKTA